MSGSRGAAVLAGATAGFAGGLFGVGGGLILVPLFTGRFHLTQHQAHGTSLAVIGATSLISIVVYALHGNVAWLTAAIVALASVVAARWGARLANRTSPVRLRQAFVVLMVAVAVRLLWKTPHGAAVPAAGWLAVPAELVIGLAVGMLAGYLGVGGGIIAVPALVLLLGMSQQRAQGTSLAVILVTAPAAAWEHDRHGNVVMRIVGPCALGAAIGAPLASLLVQRLDQTLLTRAFAVFLLANAVWLWIRLRRTPRPNPATDEAGKATT